MFQIRIASAGLTKAVYEIQKATASRAGRFRSICLQGAYATIRAAMPTLTVALLAASHRPVSAAAPDPVLEWIGVMNTTVLKAGTAPNVTGRVVALVSASVFDAVNGIEPRFRPLHVSPDDLIMRRNAQQRFRRPM